MGLQPIRLSHPCDGVTERVVVLLVKHWRAAFRIVELPEGDDPVSRTEQVGVNRLSVAFDDDHLTCFTKVVGKLFEKFGAHSGILSCFFHGLLCCLFFSVRSARISLRRVPCGMITSSM